MLLFNKLALNNEIPTTIRNCCNAVIWFRQNNMDTLRVYHKIFAKAHGKSLEEITELNSQLDWNNHEFLLYLEDGDVDETDEEKKQMYQICKIPEVPDFKIKI